MVVLFLFIYFMFDNYLVLEEYEILILFLILVFNVQVFWCCFTNAITHLIVQVLHCKMIHNFCSRSFA